MLLAITALLTTTACASLREAQEDAELPAMMRDGKVIVRLRWAGDDPWPTALHYCATVGGTPRQVRVTNYTVVYDCSPEAGGPNAATHSAATRK